jgi:hypothetical protein
MAVLHYYEVVMSEVFMPRLPLIKLQRMSRFVDSEFDTRHGQVQWHFRALLRDAGAPIARELARCGRKPASSVPGVV